MITNKARGICRGLFSLPWFLYRFCWLRLLTALWWFAWLWLACPHHAYLRFNRPSFSFIVLRCSTDKVSLFILTGLEIPQMNFSPSPSFRLSHALDHPFFRLSRALSQLYSRLSRDLSHPFFRPNPRLPLAFLHQQQSVGFMLNHLTLKRFFVCCFNVITQS